MMNQDEVKEDSQEIVAVQESSEITNKVNVVHELSINLLQTESLIRLVLQDIPFGERA